MAHRDPKHFYDLGVDRQSRPQLCLYHAVALPLRCQCTRPLPSLESPCLPFSVEDEWSIVAEGHIAIRPLEFFRPAHLKSASLLGTSVANSIRIERLEIVLEAAPVFQWLADSEAVSALPASI